MLNSIISFLESTGVYKLFAEHEPADIAKYLAMYVIIGVLFYLAIVKKFEPLLLASIAFGMLLANLPGGGVFHMDFFFDEYYISFEKVVLDGVEYAKPSGAYAHYIEDFLASLNANFNPAAYHLYTISFEEGIGTIRFDFTQLTEAQKEYVDYLFKETMGSVAKFNDEGTLIQIKMSAMVKEVFNNGGLVDFLYLGVKTGIYPSLIFLGVGAMTDFTALIANPKSLLMGAAAQFGVFVAFLGAILFGFDLLEASAIGIIGGADGPTAILVTKILAPHLLGAIAIAAYSYMALIPIIQPPFMKLLTTKNEREIVMTTLRPVSKIEKVIFPIVVAFIVCLIVPDATPLVGFLMLGNLFTVCGVTDRLSKTAQNELINIVTIMLGVSVGATANALDFLAFDTVKIIILGLAAFCISTCGGLLFGKLMCFVTKGKINPLIGSAGVSAVPMAARVSQIEGQKANPRNFLLMHAMGPNVAGVIGSAVAAGVLLSSFM
ncbi:MAG: sodium ion-translocating decarboxylase subunit beta [Clostridia bacterium]|nr:sodium ion-translocating decarboxylase subunit beta [Clostridia bacterium]